jgi:phospholipase D1/2
VTEERRARVRMLVVMAVLAALAVVLWRYTPLAQLVTPRRIAEWLGTFREIPGAPVIVVGLFVLGGLVAFPLTLLIAATGMAFEPLLAFCISVVGSLANASLTYLIGARWLHGTTSAALGGAREKVHAALRRGGIIAVAALRTLPVAPFTIVNVLAGSLHVPFRDYFLGTLLGILPGVLMMTAFGARLQRMFVNPTTGNVLVLIGVFSAWVVLALLLQRWVARPRARDA